MSSEKELDDAAIEAMNYKELQAALKERDEKATGRKEELAARLKEAVNRKKNGGDATGTAEGGADKSPAREASPARKSPARGAKAAGDDEGSKAKRQKREWGSSQREEMKAISTEMLDDIIHQEMNESIEQEAEQEQQQQQQQAASSSEPAGPSTCSVRVDGFVRPFRQSEAQQLLERHGSVRKFWMDAIKTHCYVLFETVEQAAEARRALSGMTWPVTSDAKLKIVNVPDEDVDAAVSGTVVKTTRRQASGAGVTSPGAEARPKPELKQVIKLDQLFKKTTTKPVLYYLPLTEEQASKHQEEKKKLPPPPPLRAPIYRPRSPPRRLSPRRDDRDFRGGGRPFASSAFGGRSFLDRLDERGGGEARLEFEREREADRARREGRREEREEGEKQESGAPRGKMRMDDNDEVAPVSGGFGRGGGGGGDGGDRWERGVRMEAEEQEARKRDEPERYRPPAFKF